MPPMDLRRFGRGILTIRQRRRWRQADLAAAAGVSRSQIGRIERGEGARLPVAVFERAASALGANADLALRWEGAGLDWLQDEAHAAAVEALVRRLRAAGWEAAIEASFSVYGERGSIDVLGWHPPSRALLVVEVKSVVGDLQATLHGLDRKARLAPGVARERGWAARSTARLLVLPDTRTNRRRLAEHAATVDAALPDDGRRVTRWLAEPDGGPVAHRWFLPDGRAADGNGTWRRRVRVRPAESRSRPRRVPVAGPPDGP